MAGAARWAAIGARIKQARLALASRTQQDVLRAEVARRLGVSASTVTRWEAGTHRAEPEQFDLLAELFETTPQWIVYGIGAAPSPMPAVAIAGDEPAVEPGKSGPIHMVGDGTMFGQPPTVVTPKRVAGTKRAR